MNNTARLAKIEDLLKNVPTFKCLDGCADCCGPVMMSRLEMRRIVARTDIPQHRLEAQWMLKKGCLNCPLLTPDKKCSVYDIRPAICRVFGSSDHPRLTCPHGLGPDKKMTRAETNSLIDEVMTTGLGISNPFEKWAAEWLTKVGVW